MAKENKATDAAALAERLAVVENIKKALEKGDTFVPVELGDPTVTPEMIKERIVPFDLERRKLINKIKAKIAARIAGKLSDKVNFDTEIVGIENYLAVKGAALVTTNHFNPTDSTHLRYLMKKVGDKSRLNIIIQEKNVFMTGFFGFLMNNCYTLPVSKNLSYMAGSLKPTLEKLFKRGDKVLIYPEQEMWFNYKRPRPTRIGAYHYAAEFGIPVIPCFVEMRERDTEGENGFKELRYILHIMPPIYPDDSLPFREKRDKMQTIDYNYKVKCYEEAYGRSIDAPFSPEEDIAGYPKALCT
jgi:1-acyl-sn-glycerol-3-phosphate acyltransferase